MQFRRLLTFFAYKGTLLVYGRLVVYKYLKVFLYQAALQPAGTQHVLVHAPYMEDFVFLFVEHNEFLLCPTAPLSRSLWVAHASDIGGYLWFCIICELAESPLCSHHVISFMRLLVQAPGSTPGVLQTWLQLDFVPLVIILWIQRVFSPPCCALT